MIELIDLKHAAATFSESEGPDDLGIPNEALEPFLAEQLEHPKEWHNGTPAPNLDPMSFIRGLCIGAYAVHHSQTRQETP